MVAWGVERAEVLEPCERKAAAVHVGLRGIRKQSGRMGGVLVRGELLLLEPLFRFFIRCQTAAAPCSFSHADQARVTVPMIVVVEPLLVPAESLEDELHRCCCVRDEDDIKVFRTGTEEVQYLFPRRSYNPLCNAW